MRESGRKSSGVKSTLSSSPFKIIIANLSHLRCFYPLKVDVQNYHKKGNEDVVQQVFIEH